MADNLLILLNYFLTVISVAESLLNIFLFQNIYFC